MTFWQTLRWVGSAVFIALLLAVWWVADTTQETPDTPDPPTFWY